ncbi:hypothetical protein FKM82_002349 [Ascaphus truei]
MILVICFMVPVYEKCQQHISKLLRRRGMTLAVLYLGRHLKCDIFFPLHKYSPLARSVLELLATYYWLHITMKSCGLVLPPQCRCWVLGSSACPGSVSILTVAGIY